MEYISWEQLSKYAPLVIHSRHPFTTSLGTSEEIDAYRVGFRSERFENALHRLSVCECTYLTYTTFHLHGWTHFIRIIQCRRKADAFALMRSRNLFRCGIGLCVYNESRLFLHPKDKPCV